MIFGQDRNELRGMYLDAWEACREGRPMTPLQAQISDVISAHPEYHDLIGSEELARDYTPDEGQSNPFLHMGLHLAINDQLSTNRPPGIRELFQQVLLQTGERHAAEHKLLDCLAESLWDAQRAGQLPDENAYLERVRVLASPR